MSATVLKVSASILDCDFLRLGRELEAVVKAGADAIHLDVMDGHFVSNLSFGVPLAAAVRRTVDIPVHTHLMVREPEKMISWFLPYSDMVGFHVEATSRVPDCLALIHDAGKQASISLNPDTPVSALEPYLTRVDDVLVMSVYPGRGGQKFMPAALGRVRELKTQIGRLGSGATVSVDGGVSPDNCRELAAAGADWLIAGSAVFRSTDYSVVIHSLKCLPT
jgi:ribulose-phosphate 3-epimerase